MTTHQRAKILITSALPYANGPLHFGHIAGAYLPADCYARFERLRGSDVLYICGSDEHGVAITLSAEMAGRTPKQHVDLFHEINRNFFAQLELSFDHYSRTTWPGHVQTTVDFFQDLRNNGYIEEKVTEQLYSAEEDQFLADRYVMGTCPRCGFEQARGDECQRCGASYEATDLLHPKSKISGKPLIRKPTNHWFLRFDLFKEQLTAWIASKAWKPSVVNFAKHYIEDLRPRAITRDGTWGIPVPLSDALSDTPSDAPSDAIGKIFYVWFDAPIGYISATREWAEEKGKPEAWKDYWLDSKTKLVQFVGKDNIPFHAVFFPAMTMGQNTPYKLVDELPANEFLLLEGKQFSKSEGWTIDLEAFFQKFTADQIRYTLAANAPESQDAEFTWKDFQTRCNAELLGKYGNLVNRILVFAAKHCEAAMPPSGPKQAVDTEFLAAIHAIIEQTQHAYATFHVRKASQLVMELAQTGNIYFDTKKPWTAAKAEETKPDMYTTLSSCLECLKLLALISFPIIPMTAEKLWSFLGYQEPLATQNWNHVVHTPLPQGQRFSATEVLFKRVEDESIAEEVAKLAAAGKTC